VVTVSNGVAYERVTIDFETRASVSYDLRLTGVTYAIPELKTSLFMLKNFSDASPSNLKISGSFVIQTYSTTDEIP
jgi:hypothetical protein